MFGLGFGGGALPVKKIPHPGAGPVPCDGFVAVASVASTLTRYSSLRLPISHVPVVAASPRTFHSPDVASVCALHIPLSGNSAIRRPVKPANRNLIQTPR